MMVNPEESVYRATMAGPAKMPEPMIDPTMTVVADTAPRSRLRNRSGLAGSYGFLIELRISDCGLRIMKN